MPSVTEKERPFFSTFTESCRVFVTFFFDFSLRPFEPRFPRYSLRRGKIANKIN